MNKEFYKNLLNSMKNPVLVADKKHIVIYMNKAAIEHFEEGEDLIGSNLLLCHNEESQKMMIEILPELDLYILLLPQLDKYLYIDKLWIQRKHQTINSKL